MYILGSEEKRVLRESTVIDQAISTAIIDETISTAKVIRPNASNDNILEDSLIQPISPINSNLDIPACTLKDFNQINPQVCEMMPPAVSGLCMPHNVPQSFQRALFWPLLTEKNKKRCQKEKFPTVVTSREWQTYHMSKSIEKMKKIRDIEERRKNRELATLQKKKEEEEKRKKRLKAAEERKRKIEAEREKKRFNREYKARQKQEKRERVIRKKEK